MAEMTDRELQLRILFAITVAGKSARHAERAIKRLFDGIPHPMEMIETWVETEELGQRLREARTGNYSKLSKAFAQIASKVSGRELDLRACSADDLEAIHGIGPKTARFFITWTRPDARHAVLDVHILRWLRNRGHDVPVSTPSSRKKYAEIENIFLEIADSLGVLPRDLDAAIWAAGSGHEGWTPDELMTLKTLFNRASQEEE
jgi:thermostable 8-oxoguanine DNA glycosylase